MRIAPIAGVMLAFSLLASDAHGARTGKKQLWGAIAYNSKTGTFGYAVDLASRRAAETEAFRQCGDCDVIKTFRDTCGAIAARPKKFVWETGASREIAERKALGKCGGDACQIAVWACTTQK
jgi:hypothetical protein